MSLLACQGLSAGYGGQPVVRDISFDLEPGQVLAILGPNGAGKTTLLRTLSGHLPVIDGEATVLGRGVGVGQAHRLARLGLALVPDHRGLFPSLTTVENIKMGQRRGGSSLEDAFTWFPALDRRRNVPAGGLSGGEQQMLTMARALMGRPKVLLIDEMSMGLAPTVVQSLLPMVRRIADDTGAGIVLVEQHVQLALAAADRAMVLVHGDLVLDGPAAEVARDERTLQHAYLAGGRPAHVPPPSSDIDEDLS